MPDLDGIELIQWLAEQRTSARIIMAPGCNPRYVKTAEILGTGEGILSVTRLPKPAALADLQEALVKHAPDPRT